jgi:hypothetical protein
MPDRLTELNLHLGQLLRQIMKEPDPAKYDELGAEIWRVLSERERLIGALPFSEKTENR